ncbi:heme exporter protein CcmD [Mesorhizobium sp. C120A]|uniref:heme exporter protein CcmD n=1 Tax=unclassified Mesorhizobium TaxID=325217 RepID=UPI0003D05CEB|nr:MULTISPECIES: heme exporter protein CcmD [unclassified Mesorhizobium]ESZ62392.1 transcriptional regulator [Mesorhizobium sp. L103C120A0]WJI45886.1 heme exporter protein CcmD [Mesorhizobium sp. C120A]
MSAHALYVAAAYGITAIVLAGLIGWILLDQRTRKRELADLEAAGVRRRSDKAGTGASTGAGTGASKP